MTPPDRIDADGLDAVGYRKAGGGASRVCATTSSVAKRWIARCASTCVDGRSSIRRPAISFAPSRTCRARICRGSGTPSSMATDVLDIAVDGVTMRQANGAERRRGPSATRDERTVSGDDAAQVQRPDDPGCAAAGRDLVARRPLHGDDRRCSAPSSAFACGRTRACPISTRRTTSGATHRRPMSGPRRPPAGIVPPIPPAPDRR